ncbi:reverse transcriptase domain-containing protein [Tanacetum coccineum]
MGIVKNVLIKVDKFVLLIDFVILDMLEDSRISIILRRPFLATARAMIDVFNKKITLRVGDDEVIFDMDLKTSSYNSIGNKFDNNSNVDSSIRRINPANTPYSEEQETEGTDRVKNKHLYSASANEIDKPELKKYPRRRKYHFLQVLEKRMETEDLFTDHLSRLESPHMEVSAEKEIADEFPDEHLMLLKSKFNDDEPWFGVPKALISDRGTHFYNSQLEKALQRYGVTHKLYVAYHPQSNGQTKVTNRAIKRVLERSVGYNLKDWSKKLNDALWAFRTAYKTPTGCTPFRLVYGKACHLPIEIEHKAHWALKQCDQVLLYNSRLKMYLGKLKSKWSGPNIVKTVYLYWAVEIIDRDGFSFKVNEQRLKKYYGGNIDEEDDEVIEFENGVTTSMEKKSTMLVKNRSSGILCVL